MKKILSSLVLLATLSFAYTAADVYGVWNTSGKLEATITYYWLMEALIESDISIKGSDFSAKVDNFRFSKDDFNDKWRFNKGVITFPSSYTQCQLISSNMMDCNIPTGYGNFQKKTLKKAGTIAQLEVQLKKEAEKSKKNAEKKAEKAELEAKPFYQALNKAKSGLEKRYSELENSKNLAKGEFESTGDFNKRKAQAENEFLESIKNNSENIFSQELMNVMDRIIIETAGNMKDILSNSIYDADKQIYELSLKIYGNEYKGRVKMPPEIAKKFKENLGSFSYEHYDFVSADYSIIPKKMRIYDTATKEHYEVEIAVPKNAKEIVFKGSELWLNNPYAKNISKSFSEIAKKVKEKQEAEEKAAQEEAAKKAAEKEALYPRGSVNIGGEVYPTVKINNAIWMAKNLNLNKGNSRCYNNEPENCDKYGKLYDMETAMKACPVGWHLPSKEEWNDLIKYAGGNEVAGKKLKATSEWGHSYNNGTDDYGFAALPGGFFINSEGFRYAGGEGIWWSTGKDYGGSPLIICFEKNEARWSTAGGSSVSVRCVKD
jgi:uncharacterized protein (TIGR02145 family)